MVKYIAKVVLGEELYNIKDTEVRGDLNNHASNTDIHVTAAEKEYWNSKVNPPSYSAPTAKQLTYTGEAQTLLNAGSSTVGTIQYSEDETNWSTSIPTETNAGTYTVYWRFIGSETIFVDSTAIEAVIAKATPVYSAPTAKSGLTYNGSAQDLLNAGSSNDGTFKYSSDNENWSTSIPQNTNASDSITVYWKLEGDSNHTDVASVSISCSIAKAIPTYTAPTAKSGLVYTGSAQDLLNAGLTDIGTIQYSTDNENWGNSVPQGTNANTTGYTTYWKLVPPNADYDNYEGVESTLILAPVAKADRTIVFTTAPSEVFEAQSITVTATPSAGISDGNVSYSSGDTSKATVSGDLVTGVVPGTCSIIATIGEGLNYNSATTSYTITVKHDYALDYLTFVALEDGTFSFSINNIYYSTNNGQSWNELTAGSSTPTVAAGNKILWKASGLIPDINKGIGTFSSTGDFNAEGNIMSMLFGDNFVGQDSLSGYNYAFVSLFNSCYTIISVTNLSLPATTLANYCYSSMFEYCNNLTTTPELHATTLAPYCYRLMFRGCEILTTAPKLEATTLAESCY